MVIRGGWWFWAALLGVVLAALWVRLDELPSLVGPDRIHLTDRDTMRWLAHLRARDASPEYPLRETWDGFPEGSALHWTLPMEWVLRGVTVLAAPWFPAARGHEAGALLAGPVLAVLALLVFVWLATRLLGPWSALACGACYTLAYPVSSISLAGNGDHQSLQHLLLLVGVATWLVRAAGRGGRWLGALSGAALGGAVWVSAESMVFVALLAALASAHLLRAGCPRGPLADERIRAAALALTLLVAQGLEAPAAAALTWDRVSWWTSEPALAYVGFVLLLTRVRMLLAVAAPLVGLGLGVWLVPGHAAAVARELDRMAQVYAWLVRAVDEYHSPFVWQGRFWWYAGIRRLTWLLVALPVAAVGCARLRPQPAALYQALLGLTLGTAGLAAWEEKFAHAFGIGLPLVVFVGGQGLVAALAPALRRIAGPALALLAVAAAALSLPDRTPQSEIVVERGVEELCAALAARTGGTGEVAVLAPWELGAPLLYHAQVPVVASGYHRNLDGIRDGYRAFLAQPEDAAALAGLLGRRRVRWVVAWPEREFLGHAPAIAGLPGGFVERVGDQMQLTARGQQSLYWRLRFGGGAVPGFRLVYASEQRVELPGSGPVPLFLIYEWR